jgi:hypothetical protein
MAEPRRVTSTSDRSWRQACRTVKPGDGVGERAPSGRLTRHLEGWQLGAVSVGTAILAALLLVPHPTPPDVLPLPQVDRAAQHREDAAEHARAEAARAEPLPFDVRTVGERFRRYGRASASGDEAATHAEWVELARAARAANAQYGSEPLARLRAVQGELFLGALGRWEASGKVDDELVELGGDLADKARASRWLSGERRLVATEDERMTLFRIRWTHLTGLLKTHPLSPTLDDWRVYFRFLLEHPEGRPGDCSPSSRAQAQLRYVGALEKRDPEYPASLARGVLEYRLGAPARAVLAFQDYLAQAPYGSWHLRARNYLAAARARVNDSAEP